MAPLADFAGVDRALVVTAYQSASGLLNLVNPTFAVVMGGLALGKVRYDTWLKFVWPILIIFLVLYAVLLSAAAFHQLTFAFFLFFSCVSDWHELFCDSRYYH